MQVNVFITRENGQLQNKLLVLPITQQLTSERTQGRPDALCQRKHC